MDLTRALSLKAGDPICGATGILGTAYMDGDSCTRDMDSLTGEEYVWLSVAQGVAQGVTLWPSTRI